MLILLILIFLIPFAIFFGLLGIAIQSIWAAILFSLKYLTPAIVLGSVVAFFVGKKYYFEFMDYIKVVCGFAIAGLVVMFIVLSIPVKPELPVLENTASLTVSFNEDRSETESNNGDNWCIENICNSLNELEYKRTIDEFNNEDEFEGYVFATFEDKDGETLNYIFYSDYNFIVVNGSKQQHYRVADDEKKLPYDALKNIIWDAERERKTEALRPFANALFEQIWYDDEGYINFTIPEDAPDHYSLRISLMGVDGYSEGTYDPVEYHVFQELQRTQEWEAGATYRFPISTIVYSEFDFAVWTTGAENIIFDALPLLPEASVH